MDVGSEECSERLYSTFREAINELVIYLIRKDRGGIALLPIQLRALYYVCLVHWYGRRRRRMVHYSSYNNNNNDNVCAS